MNKINKSMIGILTIFLLASITYATPVATMNKTLDIENAEGFDLTNHDGYTFAGSNTTYATMNQIDNAGNVLWNKSYDENNGSYFSDIKVTLDVGYIAVGTSRIEIRDEDGNWLSRGLIVKVDEKGNEMWRKYIQEGDFLSFKRISLTEDYGYIVVGNIRINNSKNQSFYLTKVDLDGNVLWKKILTNNTDSFASDIHQTSDGGYIISGSINSSKDAIIIKTDSNGNKQWEKILKGKGYASSIELLPSGGYIVSGYITDEFPNPDNSWITKINPKGKVKWFKSLTYGIYNEINSVKVTNDGYILAGIIFKKSGSNDSNGGILIKVDKKGNKLWSIVPGDNQYSLFKDVIEIYDNRYEAFGYKCDYTVNPTHCGVYFVKIIDK